MELFSILHSKISTRSAVTSAVDRSHSPPPPAAVGKASASPRRPPSAHRTVSMDNEVFPSSDEDRRSNGDDKIGKGEVAKAVAKTAAKAGCKKT
eukprot:10865272-Alexandrium_andersonii.AAC.1